MSYFEQTNSQPGRLNTVCKIDPGEQAMFSSEECRARAEQKLAEAERDPRHRKRLIDAGQAWLILASRMKRLEADFRVPRKRSRAK